MGRSLPVKDILYLSWFLGWSFTAVQDDINPALPPTLGTSSSLVPWSSWPRKLIQLKTKWCQPSQFPDLITYVHLLNFFFCNLLLLTDWWWLLKLYKPLVNASTAGLILCFFEPSCSHLSSSGRNMGRQLCWLNHWFCGNCPQSKN